MAVESQNLKIDPYQSTVPLVQLPVEQASQGDRPAQPLQGQFGGHKGSAGLAIGDSIIKGFMQGHALKEKKKYEVATATINASQGAEQSAWKNYQDGIIAGKTPEETAALYDAYKQAHHTTSETMAKFTIPDKPAKTPKGQPKDKSKKDGGQNVPQGFGAKLKDFMAANPHIVPQIAILSRQPNPPGLSPENKRAQQEQQREGQLIESGNVDLQNAKDMQAARKTVANYASLTPEEKAALPPDEKKALAAANSLLYSQTTSTKYQTLVDPQGQQHSVPIGTEIPEGWKLYEKPTAANTPRLGTEGEFTAQSLKQYRYTGDTAPPALLKYIHDVYGHRSAQSASTTSTSTVDVDGNRTNVNSSTRGSSEPQPPSGFAPIGSAQQGGMTAPPSSPQKNKALNPYPNPEDRPPQESLSFNQQWAKSGPYLTTLPPADEAEFQKWAKANPKAVEGELDNPQADYDVRGHWLAAKKGDPAAKLTMNKWDGKLHGSDKWKTPYNGSFSRESIYATPNAPQWKGDKLVTADGQLVTDETPKGGMSAVPTPPAPKAKGGMTAPPTAGGRPTLTAANRTMKVDNEKTTKYQTAQNKYDKAVAAANTAATKAAAAGTAFDLESAKKAALATLTQEQHGIETWYNQQVHAIGGKVPGDTKKPKYTAKDGHGTIFTSDDGIHFFDKAGKPYQEQ